MKIAIMQPYFLPYIGYFQLINAVDKFVIYDNIKFTKKGWINRNRILVNGKDEYITLPLKKDSDFLHVNERFLADSFEIEKQKILRKIKECYRKAPYFDETYTLVEEIFSFGNPNLFEFIFNSLKIICKHMQIETEFIRSSTIKIDHQLKSEQKVMAICNYLNADLYINPIGGIDLYSPADFENFNIKINFLKSSLVEYKQFKNIYIPWLSVLDIMMFNDKHVYKDLLKEYQLLNG
jgi:hypothetical protein